MAEFGLNRSDGLGLAVERGAYRAPIDTRNQEGVHSQLKANESDAMTKTTIFVKCFSIAAKGAAEAVLLDAEFVALRIRRAASGALDAFRYEWEDSGREL